MNWNIIPSTMSLKTDSQHSSIDRTHMVLLFNPEGQTSDNISHQSPFTLTSTPNTLYCFSITISNRVTNTSKSREDNNWNILPQISTALFQFFCITHGLYPPVLYHPNIEPTTVHHSLDLPALAASAWSPLLIWLPTSSSTCFWTWGTNTRVGAAGWSTKGNRPIHRTSFPRRNSTHCGSTPPSLTNNLASLAAALSRECITDRKEQPEQ